MGDTIEPRAYLEANAGHDVNGNPRRCAVVFGFVHYENTTIAQVLDVFDEGYDGYPEWVKRLGYLGQFKVTFGQYRAYLKRASVTQ